MEQILRAALTEFSAHGFASARMEDIAQRANLSKGGLYAHFRSKEAIFEALLRKTLMPTSPHRKWPPCPGDSPREAIHAFVAHLYDRLSDPDVLATLKLLIAEGHRVPRLVSHWREMFVDPFLAEQKAKLEAAAERGELRHGALVDEPSLLISPVLHAAVWRIVFADDLRPETFETMRGAHFHMLHELLEPS
ncbi:TetR/AcrR family transcriptional regulator [Marinobacter azerbaijanicus]|nr:TetR/AcrR family transcriptional regulator [Marinobacter sp. TBZ242]